MLVFFRAPPDAPRTLILPILVEAQIEVKESMSDSAEAKDKRERLSIAALGQSYKIIHKVVMKHTCK